METLALSVPHRPSSQGQFDPYDPRISGIEFALIFAGSSTETVMLMRSPHPLFELLVRAQFHVYKRMGKTSVNHIAYRDKRWYRYDPQRHVVKVARTYFELMQP